MPTFTRQTWVDAPLTTVWQFHATVDGLLTVTPEWVGLCVETVRDPNGEQTTGALEAGSTVELSVRPFGVGPRRRVVVRIDRAERGEGVAILEDHRVGGSGPRWTHAHQFFADGDRTLVRDAVEFEVPFGPLGQVAAPFAQAVLAKLFRYRHRRTQAALAPNRNG